MGVIGDLSRQSPMVGEKMETDWVEVWAGTRR